MNVIWKNGLILFGVVFVFDSILGNLLYMNPLVASLYANMIDHPGIKPWQEFGTITNFVTLNMLAGIIISFLYVIVFSLVRDRLPNSWLKAGIIFGFLVIMLKAAPEAWNQYLNINYPIQLILTQLVNSSIGILATGIILSLAWMRWPAIR